MEPKFVTVELNGLQRFVLALLLDKLPVPKGVSENRKRDRLYSAFAEGWYERLPRIEAKDGTRITLPPEQAAEEQAFSVPDLTRANLREFLRWVLETHSDSLSPSESRAVLRVLDRNFPGEAE